MNSTHDVIIIGGGLAGLTLTALLAANNINVACIDRTDTATFKNTDERTTAISYGSHLILDRAGVWPLLHGKTCPIKHIDIMDGNTSPLLAFEHDDIEQEAFGWVVDNRDLRGALYERLNTLSHAHMIMPATVSDFEIKDQAARVILEDGQTHSAKVIIGADGRKSLVRDYMDVPVHEMNYKQNAIACITRHEHPHNHIAVEHFMASGPLAILPMHDDTDGMPRSSIVLTENSGDKNAFSSLSDDTFTILLNELFPKSYGKVSLGGRRMIYPLSLVHAARYTAPRMALISDAAHGMHPIAGQGLNTGLKDVAALTDLITRGEHEIGSPAMLTEYETRRRADVTGMLAFTDGLNHLFSNDRPPLKLIRKLGLKAMNHIPAGKKFLIRRAMGL